jgi:hypothetical protein
MSGTFTIGEQKIRPGSYFRTQNVGLAPASAFTIDVVACVIQANWGPINTVKIFESETEIDNVYGSGGTTEIINLALQQGATIKAVRLGEAGTGAKGSKNLQDTAETPASAVTLTAKYEGDRNIRVAVRDSLKDTTLRELLVYDGTTLKEIIYFTKGSIGDGEPAALVAAVNAGSAWLDATKTTDGNKILAAFTATALSGGANPTVSNTDYSTAFTAIEAVQFNVLCLDTNDIAVHAIADAFLDRIYDEGKRAILVVGEPKTVAFDTRRQDAAAYNDFKIVYVLNGYEDTSGNVYEGYKAAAIIGGMIAATPSNESLTHAVVSRGKDVTEAFTNSQIEQAITSGALVFTINSSGQVQVEYGVNTLITLSATQDAGWKKIRRVRTRFELFDRIDAQVEPLVGKINNDPDGRATIIASAQGEINRMIREGKLLAGGAITEDSANPPQGDSCWFIIAVDDIDSAEKIYETYNFRFAPVTS